MTTVAYFYGMHWLTPLVFTVLIAFLTSFLSQLAFSFFTNKEFLKNGQSEMKALQKELLAMKPTDAGYSEKQNKLLDLNMAVMTHTMKPTLITMIPFLVIFFYARELVPSDQPLVYLPFSVPFAGSSLEFIGTYLVFSILFSALLRKAAKR